MSKLKNRPNFDPEVGDYASWKADVAVWKIFTDTAPEKIGGAVYLATQKQGSWRCKKCVISADWYRLLNWIKSILRMRRPEHSLHLPNIMNTVVRLVTIGRSLLSNMKNDTGF